MRSAYAYMNNKSSILYNVFFSMNDSITANNFINENETNSMKME